MNTAELKINLIHQITNITDNVRLNEILQLLKFQPDESIFVTNDEDKKAILEAREQIANGDVVSNKDVQKEIKQWLEG